jgi:hypothetical protein
MATATSFPNSSDGGCPDSGTLRADHHGAGDERASSQSITHSVSDCGHAGIWPEPSSIQRDTAMPSQPAT